MGQSVIEPLKYYENNFISSCNLISSMIKNGCKKIIFSSSAAIYGKPNTYPIVESFKLKPINPAQPVTKILLVIISKYILNLFYLLFLSFFLFFY